MNDAKTGSATGKKPNLFKKAKAKAVKTTTTAKKGTVFLLPKDLDGKGELVEECKEMHDAITDAIASKAAEKSAKGRGESSKGVVLPFVNREYAKAWANLGIQPPTPVALLNHKGDKLTFMVVDKSQQYVLKDDQVELLHALVGGDTVLRMVETVDTYKFEPHVMGQVAGDLPPIAPDASNEERVAHEVMINEMDRVEDVVFEAVQEAILANDRLTDEQKEGLIGSDSVTRVRRGIIPRLAEFCGSDAQRISDVIDALGSSCNHYLKT